MEIGNEKVLTLHSSCLEKHKESTIFASYISELCQVLTTCSNNLLTLQSKYECITKFGAPESINASIAYNGVQILSNNIQNFSQHMDSTLEVALLAASHEPPKNIVILNADLILQECRKSMQQVEQKLMENSNKKELLNKQCTLTHDLNSKIFKENDYCVAQQWKLEVQKQEISQKIQSLEETQKENNEVFVDQLLKTDFQRMEKYITAQLLLIKHELEFVCRLKDMEIIRIKLNNIKPIDIQLQYGDEFLTKIKMQNYDE